MPIVIAALLVNVAIDVTLLPEIGVVAAAIATDVAYTLYVIGHLWLCYRLVGLELRPLLVTLTRTLLAAGAMALVLLAFGPPTCRSRSSSWADARPGRLRRRAVADQGDRPGDAHAGTTEALGGSAAPGPLTAGSGSTGLLAAASSARAIASRAGVSAISSQSCLLNCRDPKKSDARMPTSATNSARPMISSWVSPACMNERGAGGAPQREQEHAAEQRQPHHPELGERLEVHVVRHLGLVHDEVVAHQRPGSSR